ncbi:MAG: hypothetical protein AVDCRST_MAG70-1042 [uncultured Thermomicrobiales bacterium]|uniref:Uncharacterized protein n=1 Tax=uncultured Thermomicrobiales bacterium TaxID=1645740 RepID=A0A6J4UJE5_9BACT|nr:MAG: hypothetical protein AVDCRST_MAG70-1042 [uncultured Thermomicrobiales bacterium]
MPGDLTSTASDHRRSPRTIRWTPGRWITPPRSCRHAAGHIVNVANAARQAQTRHDAGAVAKPADDRHPCSAIDGSVGALDDLSGTAMDGIGTISLVHSSSSPSPRTSRIRSPTSASSSLRARSSTLIRESARTSRPAAR